MTRREFAIEDINEIIEILDECKVLHLGLSDEGMPYVVSMNYGYEMIDGKLTLYIHGATTGYKLDIMKKNPNVFAEMNCRITPFEGKIACQYGTAYYSVMARGKATILEDPREKMHAMSVLMKTQTGKDFTFNERLVSIVSAIRIDVDEYTAKHRPDPEEMKAMDQKRMENS